jgi:hypothetical protein
MFKVFALLIFSSSLMFGHLGEKDKQALLAKIGDKETALAWVISGDSFTHGAWFTKGDCSYPEYLAEHVRGEMLRFRDIIMHAGVSGEVITGLLGDFDWRVLRFKPDVVSIKLGIHVPKSDTCKLAC